MDALLDQEQLACVVGLVGVEGGVKLAQRSLGVVHPLGASRRIWGFVLGDEQLLFQPRAVARAPEAVVGVELAQHMYQLGQHAHGVGARATGWVEHFELLDGTDEGLSLGRGEAVRFFPIAKQVAQARRHAVVAGRGRCRAVVVAHQCGGDIEIKVATAWAKVEHGIDSGRAAVGC